MQQIFGALPQTRQKSMEVTEMATRLHLQKVLWCLQDGSCRSQEEGTSVVARRKLWIDLVPGVSEVRALEKICCLPQQRRGTVHLGMQSDSLGAKCLGRRIGCAEKYKKVVVIYEEAPLLPIMA